MATSDVIWLILVSGVLPALAAGSILACGWWFTCRRSLNFCRNSAWPNACAIASSYWVAFLGLQGFPSFPPNESRGWLFYWLALVVLLEWGSSKKKIPAVAAWPLTSLLTGASLYFVLRATVNYQWTAGETGVWLSGLTLVCLGFWQALAGASRRFKASSECWAFLGVLLFSTGILAISLGASGSVKLAQHGVALGTALAVYGCFNYFGKAMFIHVGGLAPMTVVYLGLLLNGVFYSELPRTSAILLLTCPLAPWLCQFPGLKKRPLLQRLALMATVLILAGGWAVWLALASREVYEYTY